MLKSIIQKIPVPLAGVMLATSSLGNLLQPYNEIYHTICGIIAGFLLVLCLIKFIMYPKMIKEDLTNPVIASVSTTFTMGLMVMCTYFKPFIGEVARYIWIIAIILHVALMIYFTLRFVIKPVWDKVFATYFVPIVGIVVASVTAPAFEMQDFGVAIFWFGFITYILLLPYVTYRYIKYAVTIDGEQPLICIYAAPASLTLAGYLSCESNPQTWIVYFLIVLATFMWGFIMLQMPKLLKLQFFPSYAAMTFPFVISAVACGKAADLLQSDVLSILSKVEMVWAIIIVGYVIIRYIKYLFIDTARPYAKASRQKDALRSE